MLRLSPVLIVSRFLEGFMLGYVRFDVAFVRGELSDEESDPPRGRRWLGSGSDLWE